MPEGYGERRPLKQLANWRNGEDVKLMSDTHPIGVHWHRDKPAPPGQTAWRIGELVTHRPPFRDCCRTQTENRDGFCLLSRAPSLSLYLTTYSRERLELP